MALVLADRVQEYSTTTGTGTLTLSGAYAGFQTFAAGIGNGNTCYYTITSDKNQWEVGIGTVGTGTLARTTLISSSSGSFVSFTGTLTVFVTYPAEKSVYGEGAVIVAPSGALLPITSGGTGASTTAAARTALGLGTIATQDANAVAVTGGAISNTSITVKDNVFTLQDDVDPTKQAQFQISTIATGTTVTYALPAPGVSVTLAALSASQIFSNSNTFSNGTNTFGSATTASTIGLASGATTTGNTKTVNVGTGGLSGSTTNITVGSANGSTTTMLGTTVIGGASGNQSLQVNNVASAVNYAQIVGAVAGSAPSISAQGADANVNLQLLAQGAGTVNAGAITNGTNQFNVAVNAAIYRVGGGGAFRWIAMNTSFLAPSIVTSGQVLGNQEFQGYDGTTYRNGASVRAEVDGTPGASSMPGRLILSTTLSGATTVTERFRIDNAGIISLGAAVGTESLRVNPTASAVNRIDLTGAATGSAPTISAQGSDANINLRLTPKGTGTLQFGTYTAGVLTPTGYITITDAGGTSRRLLVG